MQVTKHTRVTGEKVKDATLATVDIADDSITAAKVLDHTLGSYNLSTHRTIIGAGTQIRDAIITEAKFYEHLEHGTINAVTLTGRYKSFTTAFGAAPDVMVTAVGTYDARVGLTPAAGSFKAHLDIAGTAMAMFVAWGDRA